MSDMLTRIFIALLLAGSLGFAQQQPDLTGDYAGMVGPLRVKLHLVAAKDGTLTGTVDSPDQGLTGLQCADIHVKGQSLSFSVPAVNGSWIGFISANGTALSGTWNQGAPMPLNLTRVVAGAGGPAPTLASGPPGGQVSWDDYTFKFDASGNMAQVFEGGKVVGTILAMNGDLRVLPMPGTDADKLRKSFDDYKAFASRSHSPGGTATVAAAPPAVPAPGAVPRPGFTRPAEPETIQFDDANHTIVVPRPNGVVVTFVGNDVKVAGYRRLNYILRRQKGSPGRFLEHTIGHRDSVGGSISGGGEEFLLDGGGLIYDSGMGTNGDMQVNSPVLQAKQLSQIAVDAVADVRKVAGREDFTPPGYNTLLEISKYRLRSDGSR
jgi:hypothetical protein